jgi:hypothetical protein
MQHAGGILKRLIRDYGLEAGLALSVIQKQWQKLVGDTISAHTFPDFFKGGTILIIVDTPQWMHHLSFYKQDILNKLRPYKVKDLRFKLGRLPEREGSREAVNHAPLSEDEERFIEETIENLEDDGLKLRFRTLLAHSMKHRKRQV